MQSKLLTNMVIQMVYDELEARDNITKLNLKHPHHDEIRIHTNNKHWFDIHVRYDEDEDTNHIEIYSKWYEYIRTYKMTPVDEHKLIISEMVNFLEDQYLNNTDNINNME